MKRILRVLDVGITTLLVICIASTTYLAIAARRSPDKIPSVFGRKVLTVLSGSMEPVIRTGDVILVRPLRTAEAIGEGDIITYRSAERSTMLITHRVQGVVSVDGKVSGYVTKGDANGSPDGSLVAPLQVLGKYDFRIPYYGYITNFIRKPLGIVLVVIIPGVVLIGMEVTRLGKLMAKEEAEEPTKTGT